MSIGSFQIIELNWRDHIAADTTLEDAVNYCLLTVQCDKWRDDEQHDQQSWYVDILPHFAFEEYGEEALLLELSNQTGCIGWAHWLLHDRIQLQILVTDCLMVNEHTHDNEVIH